MKTYSNDELYHYGVLGMKWGTRRSQKQLDRLSRRSKKEKWSDDAIEAAKIKTKKVSQMSNTELNKLNNRQNLERQHRQLNPGIANKGLRVAAGVAAGLGTIAALHANSSKVIDIGKSIGNKLVDRIGDWVVKGIRF